MKMHICDVCGTQIIKPFYLNHVTKVCDEGGWSLKFDMCVKCWEIHFEHTLMKKAKD